MFTRQFIVLISAFVTFISSFDLLFVFPVPQPKVTVINLNQVTPKVVPSKRLVYRQSLLYTDSRGHSRTIHTISEIEATWFITYLHPTLSPKGNFIATNYTTYEGARSPSIFRVSDNKDLVSGVDLNFDVQSDLMWSPDERFFVVISFHNDFGSTGRPGLFISYSPFSKIEPIIEFSTAQHLAGYRITHAEIDNNKILFTLSTDASDKSFLPKYYSYTLK